MGSVVVVGSGLAGLVAAWRLQRSGHDVEVLEADEAVGGRHAGVSDVEAAAARGASVLHTGDRNLHAVITALGLSDRLREPQEGGTALCVGRRLVPFRLADPAAVLRMRGLSPLARLRWLRWAARLRGEASPLRSEHLRALDREEGDTYLGRCVGREVRDTVLRPWLGARLACELEDLSAAGVLLALRESLASGRPRTFVGGLEVLAQRLAESLPVRRRCRVESIETGPDGARVRLQARGRARLVLADAVVVATPAPLVAGLCPKLTPAEREFTSSVVYGPGLAVRLSVAERRLPRALDVALAHRPGAELARVTIHRAEPGAGERGSAWHVQLREAAAARWWEADPEPLVSHVVGELARTPLGRPEVRAAAVHRAEWLLPRFAPGAGGRLAAFLRRGERSPRLAFAGDYLVGTNAEAAGTSGMRAAVRLEQELAPGVSRRP